MAAERNTEVFAVVFVKETNMQNPIQEGIFPLS